VSRYGLRDGVDESVLLQCQPGKPVVPAVEVTQVDRQRCRFDPRDAPDERLDASRREVIGSKTRSHCSERCASGVAARAQGGHRGVGVDVKRLHSGASGPVQDAI
jgi:hypothetical protein